MIRTTRSVSMLGAAALLLALTACGSDDSEYCDRITSAEEDTALADVDPTDAEAMAELSGTIRGIADVAPEDIKGDWESFADSIEAFDPDTPPTEEQSETVLTSLENIDAHVQEECDFELS